MVETVGWMGKIPCSFDLFGTGIDDKVNIDPRLQPPLLFLGIHAITCQSHGM